MDEIESWIASLPSDAAAIAAMQEHRVPCAPVLSVEEAINHPHLREHRTIRKVDDPIFGEFDGCAALRCASAFLASCRSPRPHSASVNREVLESSSSSPERIASLEQSGVLQSGKC